MSFQEQVQADIDAVFLNAFEFAEKHKIDNVECLDRTHDRLFAVESPL